MLFLFAADMKRVSIKLGSKPHDIFLIGVGVQNRIFNKCNMAYFCYTEDIVHLISYL